MDLFETNFNSGTDEYSPLAERMRPKLMDDFVGQASAVGVDSSLMKIIKKRGIVPNIILWGPPGTGKTTFGYLLAGLVKAEFISINAVDTGAKRLREIGQQAHERRLQYQKTTIVFVDEIHRLNRAQQDVLLPFAEKGDFSLVGATTENPSYELNSALLSRSRVVVFERLSPEDLSRIIERAVTASEAKREDVFSSEAEQELIAMANGDARSLLSLLDQVLGVYQETQQTERDQWPLSVESLRGRVECDTLYYDKSGDMHYDTISAFIKSIRGSDSDGALYYLARMIQGGEDPIFIARRLVVAASEDVGNADPRALQLAVAGLEAVRLVGLPEAGINLAQVVTYLASAPKSNRSYRGFKGAMQCVRDTGNLPIPMALRSAQAPLMRSMGRGEGYLYPHDEEKGWVRQQYLPDQLKDLRFYEPSDLGFEKNIRKYRAWQKNEKTEEDVGD